MTRLQAAGGLRVGVAASIGIHAVLLGVATVIASDAAFVRGNGGAGDGEDGEPHIVLDLRPSVHVSQPVAQPEPEPTPTPEPLPKIDPEQTRLAASAVLEPLKQALRKAFSPETRATEEPPALPAIADAPSSHEPSIPETSSASNSAPSLPSSSSGSTASAAPPAPAASEIPARPAVVAATSAAGADGGSTERAALLEGSPPAYPPKSLRAGEHGDVRCVLHVHADGTVDSVDVLRSSGVARLDDAAREALLRWRFRPAKRNGLAIPCEIEHTVTFRLR